MVQLRQDLQRVKARVSRIPPQAPSEELHPIAFQDDSKGASRLLEESLDASVS